MFVQVDDATKHAHGHGDGHGDHHDGMGIKIAHRHELQQEMPRSPKLMMDNALQNVDHALFRRNSTSRSKSKRDPLSESVSLPPAAIPMDKTNGQRHHHEPGSAPRHRNGGKGLTVPNGHGHNTNGHRLHPPPQSEHSRSSDGGLFGPYQMTRSASHGRGAHGGGGGAGHGSALGVDWDSWVHEFEQEHEHEHEHQHQWFVGICTNF